MLRLLLKGAIVPASLAAVLYAVVADPFGMKLDARKVGAQVKEILDATQPQTIAKSKPNTLVHHGALLFVLGNAFFGLTQIWSDPSSYPSHLDEEKNKRRLEREKAKAKPRPRTVAPEDVLPEHTLLSDVVAKDEEAPEELEDEYQDLDAPRCSWHDGPKAWIASFAPWNMVRKGAPLHHTEKTRRKERNLCYYCGDPGHWLRDCPKAHVRNLAHSGVSSE